MLNRFPQNYHEPYFKSYLIEDFALIANQHGLLHLGDTKAFVSKVMVFEKNTV